MKIWLELNVLISAGFILFGDLSELKQCIAMLIIIIAQSTIAILKKLEEANDKNE